MKKTSFIIFYLFWNVCLIGQISNSERFHDEVFQYLCDKKILNPDIAMQQAIIETGGFQHNNTSNKNNLFGFKKAGNIIKFESWKQSIDFYKDWQFRKYTDTTENYYDFLRRIKFASSKKYINDLKSVRYKGDCKEDTSNNTLISADETSNNKEINKKSQKFHFVKKGENLYFIAHKYKITVKELKKLNKLKSSKIKPGLKLKID